MGNGATDWDYDVSPVFPEVVYNFNLIPPRLIKNYTSNGCTFFFNDVRKPSPDNAVCNDLWNQINDLWVGLNWYDLFRKTYPNSALPADKNAAITEMSRTKTVIIGGQEKTYKSGYTF